MSSIAEQVQHLVAEHFGGDHDRVTPQATFGADLGISAKQSALLRRKVEQHLHVTLPKGEAKRLATVGDLIRHVERHQS